MHRGRFENYTKEEDEIIRYHLKDATLRHVSGRCREITKYLPGRTSENIRKRWYELISEPEIPIKNLKDLLSPEQRKRIRVRFPSMTKNYIDPRTGRKAT